MEAATPETMRTIPSPLCSGSRGDEADSQSQFARRESELSTEELLLPEETTGFFLPESTAILSKSPPIYPQ